MPRWRRQRCCIVLVLGVVFTFRTPEGTLVVTVNEPDAEITVDDGKVTLKSPGDEEPVEIEVAEGQHTLKVTKGGFETFTDQFTIKSGGREVFDVTLWPLPAAKAESGKPESRPRRTPRPRSGRSHRCLSPIRPRGRPSCRPTPRLPPSLPSTPPREEAPAGVGRLPGRAGRARLRPARRREADDGADPAGRVPDGLDRGGAGTLPGRGEGGQTTNGPSTGFPAKGRSIGCGSRGRSTWASTR